MLLGHVATVGDLGMADLRTWLKCVCLLSFLCGVVVPLVLFVLTNGYDDLDGGASPFMATVRGFEGRSYERKPLDYNAAEVQVIQEDMQYQVQELQRIVVSVRNELRQLEQERNQVSKELDMSKHTLSKVRREVGVAKSSLQDSKGKLAKALREMKRANQYEGQPQASKSPVVVVNLPDAEKVYKQQVVDDQLQTVSRDQVTASDCFDDLCFDYSRCPLTSSFSVYVYNQQHPNLFDLKDPTLVKTLVESLQQQDALVSDPDLACVFVIVTGPLRVDMDDKVRRHKLTSLPYWNGGTNHVILNMAYHNQTLHPVAKQSPLGTAILAKSYSSIQQSAYNIVLPPVTSYNKAPLWNALPPFLPALRQILMIFEGNLSEDNQRTADTTSRLGSHLVWVSNKLLTSLLEAITSRTQDKVIITTNCGKLEPGVNHHGEWLLCGSAQTRAQILSKSTFSLVIGSQLGSVGPVTYTRLVEALRYGAVPVILGVKHLPFDSVIDWSKAAVVVPPTSLGQLHYILRGIDMDTILQYRRQGRFLWETYFSSPLSIMSTVMAIVRQRTLHPPPPAMGYVAATNLASIPGDNRVLESPEFLYNFTSYATQLWNSPPGPFYMYPTTPFKPTPLSGSRYVNLDAKQISNLPQHVIAAGGITGPFFEDYLLGDVPNEQFTVVMLTYERNEVLLEALGRLKDLDNLAKVLVVWNSPKPPPTDMKWPEIGAAIDVSD